MSDREQALRARQAAVEIYEHTREHAFDAAMQPEDYKAKWTAIIEAAFAPLSQVEPLSAAVDCHASQKRGI
jgi:hypothetical protein